MKGRWTVQVRLADRFDANWFESIYDVNYFWIRFFLGISRRDVQEVMSRPNDATDASSDFRRALVQ